MDNFYDAVIAYKLVWLKVILLVIMPAAMLFDSYTETWSQAELANQSAFTLTRLGIKMFLASSAAFIAFIDNSLKKAQDDYDKRKFQRVVDKEVKENKEKGDTAFIVKPQPPIV